MIRDASCASKRWYAMSTCGGWLALRLTGSQGWLFTALAVGLLLYGILIPVAIIRGAWSSGRAAA